ncbi:MAG: hypothetical protein OXU61_01480 [Gammaproteobacteria bacterium]|nr:hypothetical protein [Gammaproteobacteria bacterium]
MPHPWARLRRATQADARDAHSVPHATIPPNAREPRAGNLRAAPRGRARRRAPPKVARTSRGGRSGQVGADVQAAPHGPEKLPYRAPKSLAGGWCPGFRCARFARRHASPTALRYGDPTGSPIRAASPPQPRGHSLAALAPCCGAPSRTAATLPNLRRSPRGHSTNVAASNLPWVRKGRLPSSAIAPHATALAWLPACVTSTGTPTGDQYFTPATASCTNMASSCTTTVNPRRPRRLTILIVLRRHARTSLRDALSAWTSRATLGDSPDARMILRTVEWWQATPAASAIMDRALASLPMILASIPGGATGGRPERGRSGRAARPPSLYRLGHLRTHS